MARKSYNKIKIKVDAKKLFQEPGKCPKCGSFNIEYGSTELEGNSLGYEFSCEDCGAYGLEWYNLEYSETLVNGIDK